MVEYGGEGRGGEQQSETQTGEKKKQKKKRATAASSLNSRVHSCVQDRIWRQAFVTEPSASEEHAERLLWLVALSVSPLLLLWVTHSFCWCNINIVAAAPPLTQLQYHLCPSLCFNCLSLIPCFSLSPLHFLSPPSIFRRSSNFPRPPPFCFYPPPKKNCLTWLHLSTAQLTYFPANRTVEEVRLVFTKCGRSPVSGSVGHWKSLPLILSLSCLTATCERLTRRTSATQQIKVINSWRSCLISDLLCVQCRIWAEVHFHRVDKLVVTSWCEALGKSTVKPV